MWQLCSPVCVNLMELGWGSRPLLVLIRCGSVLILTGRLDALARVLLLKLHYCVFLAPFGLGGLSPAAAITV